MTQTEIHQLLRESLEDYRLSRSEKRTLQKLAETIRRNQQELARLRSDVFEIAQEESLSPNEKRTFDWLQDVLKAIEPRKTALKVESEVIFSPDDACAQKIVGTIKSARQNMDVCVFTITDNRISQAMIEAHHRGVAIRVITDDLKAEDLGSDIYDLERSGVEVRKDRAPDSHMHHKFAVVDRRRLLTGSYNWTRSAATVNEENLIVTNDPVLVGEFQDQFDHLWKKFA